MDNKLDRRKFIKDAGIFVGAVSVVGVSSLLNSCESYVANDYEQGITVEIDVNSREYKRYLTKIGAGLLKKFDGVNFGVAVIIVKIAENTYRCFSSMCTHNNCYGRECFHSHDPAEREKSDVRPPIGKTLEARSIVCKCHGSRYDPFNEGIPYQGPAERPLTQYKCDFNPETGILKIRF